MKIDKIAVVPHTNSVNKIDSKNPQNKDFSSALNMKEGSVQGINLPRNSNKEMVQNFAEWYFKQGKAYENSHSYKQAISAYEKANSVEPDISKSSTIDTVRSKEFKE
jgi:tetratricopeptide (TPR) repeat protein